MVLLIFISFCHHVILNFDLYRKNSHLIMAKINKKVEESKTTMVQLSVHNIPHAIKKKEVAAILKTQSIL